MVSRMELEKKQGGGLSQPLFLLPFVSIVVTEDPALHLAPALPSHYRAQPEGDVCMLGYDADMMTAEYCRGFQ